MGKKKVESGLITRLMNTGDKILDATESTAKHTLNFLEKETPEVTKEIIRWGIIDTGVWFLGGLFLTLICGAKLELKVLFSALWYTEVIYAILLIIGVSLLFSSTEWIKPMATPLLYLLEWLYKKTKK